MTHLKRVVIILFTCLWGCDSLDNVEQKTRVQTAVEGETVTINCTYSTTDSFPYLFWYQQEINGYPRYMLKKFPGSGEVDKQFEGRFDAKLNTSRTSVPLTIKKVCVSDSAVYFCALRPTVTETHSTLIQKPCQ
uniref:T-cell receptor alpha/delta variable 30.0.6 n=1 Tax=Cyprinus carpio carpio TaxID=630221 RepID=A0A9J7XFM0_CYPCA